MEDILLSITIPTYNRVHFLKQTLDILLPQVHGVKGVEVIIFDNCSPDGTADYIASLGSAVKHVRHEVNIGSERNFVSCFQQANGRFAWLLCDDDFPSVNAVECILEAIKRFPDAPMIYLRAVWRDRFLTGYDFTPVTTDWHYFDADGFLKEISYYFTFATSMIARRECINYSFIETQLLYNLVPAAIALSTVGGKGAVISDTPLVHARGDNSGGYNGYTVFTKRIKDLLNACAPDWFSPQAKYQVYNENLNGIVRYIVDHFPIDKKGFRDALESSYEYPAFWKVIFPKIIRNTGSTILSRLFGKSGNFIPRKAHSLYQQVLSNSYKNIIGLRQNAADANFRRTVGNVGSGGSVQHPFLLQSAHRVTIGSSFQALAGLHLEVIENHSSPQAGFNIHIADNVSFGTNVHVCAYGLIKIGNNVIVGNHVQIRDFLFRNSSAPEGDSIGAGKAIVYRSDVLIDDNVYIGDGVCIQPGVHIGKNAVICENSVVDQDVAANETVVGNPAKPVSDNLISYLSFGQPAARTN